MYHIYCSRVKVILTCKVSCILWDYYAKFFLVYIQEQFFGAIYSNQILFRYSRYPHGRNTAIRRHSREHRKCPADIFCLH